MVPLAHTSEVAVRSVRISGMTRLTLIGAILWQSVDVLLGRGRVPANSAIDAESFNRFFAEKVA